VGQLARAAPSRRFALNSKESTLRTALFGVSQPMLRIASCMALGCVGAWAQQPASPTEEVRRTSVQSENVLGTSMRLEISAEASKLKGARRALTEEIERLEDILSTWSTRSELARLPCPPTKASSELREVLKATERWMGESGGAFHPAVGVLTKLWNEAGQRGALPSESELASARARIGSALWRIEDATGTVEFLSDVPLTFDGLAKGYIIDRAIAAAVKAGAIDVVLDIGGDVRVWGKASSTVAIADPKNSADNAQPLGQLQLQGAAVATSGGYARGFDIAGVHYSHIFDPRSGMPVTEILQATVIASDATTADALATALNVLAPADGLALVARVPGAASMVVDSQGKQHASPGWSKFLRTPPAAVAAPSGPSALPGGGLLVLAFELQQPPTGGERGGPSEGRGGERGRGGDRRGGGYRRPYVAAWIEDAQGKSVRTLALWVEKPRWIPDLRRWTRLYDRREQEVSAVTRATRAPGNYELAWDGLDDAGVAVSKGSYSLHLEVVREHGTYQWLSGEFELDGKEFLRPLEGAGIEVKSAAMSYRPRKP
jgi:thiamine biosynthesis lipoprotein ApbE